MSSSVIRKTVLTAAVLSAMPCLHTVAQSTTWLNLGTDFSVPANWSNGVPSATVAAVFPATATAVNPGVLADGTALGLSFDNTGGAGYNLTSNSSFIRTGASGISVNGGSTNFDAPLGLLANQPINIAAASTLRLGGALDCNGMAFTKQGDGTLVLTGIGSGTPPTTANRIVVQSGTLRYENSLALGTAVAGGHSMLLKAGATFEIQPSETENAIWGVRFDTTLGTLLGSYIEMENGSTIRGLEDIGGAGSFSAIVGGGRSARVVNGSTVTYDAPTGNAALVMSCYVGNATETLASSGSTINLTGSGQIYVQGGSVGTNAYTGSWEMAMSTADFGLAYLNSSASLGQRAGGAPATLRVTSGYMVEPASSTVAGSAFTNPITMNGGILALSQAAGARTTPAVWSGGMAVNDLTTEASYIRLSEVFGGVTGAANMSVNQSGLFSGAGVLYIFGNTTLGAAGTFKVGNTSTVTPNTFSGAVIVSNAAALDVSTTATGSDPLGTGDVFLQGGSLIVQHPGAGTLTTYANNSILVTSSSSGGNGSLTIGNGNTTTTGSVVQLGLLQFDNSGAGGNQTFTVSNATGTSNYSASFANLNTGTSGIATITTGANAANLTVSGIVVGGASLYKAGGNTVTLNAISNVDPTPANQFTGEARVLAGTLAFNSTARLGTLTIDNGSKAVVTAGANKLLRVTNLNMPGSLTEQASPYLLSVTGTNTLDVGSSDLIVDQFNDPVITQESGKIPALIRAGYNSGAWTGNGITSSAAAAIAASADPHKRALGYRSDLTSYRGETIPAGGTVVAYTYAGDADLDGRVTTTDFNPLAGHFGQQNSPTTGIPLPWQDGNFNYDEAINSQDFNILVSNFGAGAGVSLTPYGGPLLGALPGNPELSLSVSRAMLEKGVAIEEAGFRGPANADWTRLMGIEGSGQIGSAVPEPASASLLALAAGALLGRRRRI